ncbi:MAG TPA: peptide deformylase, partial [Agromyces sp.]
MPERPIRLFGDPVLKTVSSPVEQIDDRVRALVDDLVDSVRLPGRAGVAAPQIGVNLRVFSYNVDGEVG